MNSTGYAICFGLSEICFLLSCLEILVPPKQFPSNAIPFIFFFFFFKVIFQEVHFQMLFCNQDTYDINTHVFVNHSCPIFQQLSDA